MAVALAIIDDGSAAGPRGLARYSGEKQWPLRRDSNDANRNLYRLLLACGMMEWRFLRAFECPVVFARSMMGSEGINVILMNCKRTVKIIGSRIRSLLSC